MLEEGYVEQNPTIDLKAPKVEKKPPCILTAQEIRTLLAQPTGKDSKALRDKAMLELLYATGIRVSELVALNIDDVDLERGSIKCDNNNKRIVPVNTQALYYLKQYLFYARGLMIRDDSEVALFVNFHGNRMTRQGFWKLIKHYTSEAKIDKDITPHTLRHSFAIHLLNDGADIHRLKEILGHSALSTTQVYAQFSNKDAEQNREKENPGI